MYFRCGSTVPVIFSFSSSFLSQNALFGVLYRKLGSGHLYHEAVVLGRRYTGDEAAAAGIVQAKCPPGQALDTALTWVQKALPKGGYSRDNLANMKEDIYGYIFDIPASQYSRL